MNSPDPKTPEPDEKPDSQPRIPDEPALPDAEDLPGTPRPDKTRKRPSY